MPRHAADTITVNVVAYSDRRDLVLRYRDPSTRRVHTRTAGTDSRREATKLAAQWEADLNTGRWKPGQRIEWEAFREKFEEQHLSGLAPKSQRKAKGVLTMFGRLMSPYMLDGITSAMLSEYVAKLRRSKIVAPSGKSKDRSETTIKGHLQVLTTALRWSKSQGFLSDIPAIPRIARARKSGRNRLMKGRAPTPAEFETMVASVVELTKLQPPLLLESDVPATQRFLWLLRLSGLRLSEALDLWWDRHDRLHVVIGADERPYLAFHAEDQKSHSDELLPVTREFGEWLLTTPPDQRHGRVAPLPSRRRQANLTNNAASKRLLAIGRAANVIVDARTNKPASAHDIRRLFVTDLLRRFAPAIVQKLARHQDIATTMSYYEDLKPSDIADEVWGFQSKNDQRKR